MSLSTKAVEALTAPETDQVFLFLLRLSVDGSLAFRAVNNTQSITSNGIAYTPCGFKVVLPPQNTDGGTKSCKLEIDNIDQIIMETVASAIGKEITVEIEVILAATPDIIERGPVKLILRNVTGTTQSVSGELYDFYVYDRNIPEGRYTPKDFPGLF